MRYFIISIFLLLFSSTSFADAINLKKISYPLKKLDVTTNVIISDNGRIDYSNRISNGNRAEGFHILTTVTLKDSKGNVLRKLVGKKGINASYGGRTVVIKPTKTFEMDKNLVKLIDKSNSTIVHDRVSGDFKLPDEKEIEKALKIGKYILTVFGG